MTTSEIANRLVELCRRADFETAQKELFADNVISIEPYATKDFEKETRGLEAVFAKGKKFHSMIGELHETKIEGPLVAGNAIAFTMWMDITMKGKDRAQIGELCVYEVKDGKVISERFYM